MIGSRAELEERARPRARAAAGAAPALDRRGADPLRVVRRGGASASPRSATPGSTPASSASRRSAGRTPEWIPQRLRDRRGAGPHGRRPARPRLLGAVVPGRLGLGDARADPALVLLAVLHVGRRSIGRSPYRRVLAYEKMLDETGREMHKSWGNAIDAERRVRADGRRRHALAVLRAAAEPEPPLRLRAGARGQAAAAHALELGHVLRHTTRTSRGSRLRRRPAEPDARSSRSTAGSSPRARAARRRGDRRVRAAPGRRPSIARLRGVRRRPLELVHPPLAPALLGRRCRAALRTPSRSLSWLPVPFLAEHLWRARQDDQPESIFLTTWPEGGRAGTSSCSNT